MFPSDTARGRVPGREREEMVAPIDFRELSLAMVVRVSSRSTRHESIARKCVALHCPSLHRTAEFFLLLWTSVSWHFVMGGGYLGQAEAIIWLSGE